VRRKKPSLITIVMVTDRRVDDEDASMKACELKPGDRLTRANGEHVLIHSVQVRRKLTKIGYVHLDESSSVRHTYASNHSELSAQREHTQVAPPLLSGTPQTFTIQDHERSFTFDGELLGQGSSFESGKLRWFDVAIYRTTARRYVVAGAGRTVVPGETDRRWVRVAEDADGAIELLHIVDGDGVRYMTNVAKSAVAEAAARDEELRKAFTIQRIA
jgi:hypothetical protein